MKIALPALLSFNAGYVDTAAPFKELDGSVTKSHKPLRRQLSHRYTGSPSDSSAIP